jgi:hypothetical protein
MPIEIPCPACRLSFRADGTSRTCPLCGANRAIRTAQARGIALRIVRRKEGADERVRNDPREGHSYPPHLHLPIPQHGEPQPVESVGPDEDDPGHGDCWPFGPAPPHGPRMRALYEINSSTTRVASLLTAPLKRLQPLYVLLMSVLGWLALFGGLAYWLLDDHPYLALVVAFAGCLVIHVGAMHLLGMSIVGLPVTDADENPIGLRDDEDE